MVLAQEQLATGEIEELPFVLDEAADAVESLLALGLLDAQQQVHAPR